jgi:hypothetical protein
LSWLSLPVRGERRATASTYCRGCGSACTTCVNASTTRPLATAVTAAGNDAVRTRIGRNKLEVRRVGRHGHFLRVKRECASILRNRAHGASGVPWRHFRRSALRRAAAICASFAGASLAVARCHAMRTPALRRCDGHGAVRLRRTDGLLYRLFRPIRGQLQHRRRLCCRLRVRQTHWGGLRADMRGSQM